MGFITATTRVGKSLLDKASVDVLPTLGIRTERGLKVTAEFVRDEAKLRAPVDTGKLEDNIRVNRVDKNTYQVISDAEANGQGYAAFLHEDPNWNLGPKSREKQEGSSVVVGNKWLVRAVDENSDTVKEIFREQIKLKVGR